MLNSHQKQRIFIQATIDKMEADLAEYGARKDKVAWLYNAKLRTIEQVQNFVDSSDAQLAELQARIQQLEDERALLVFEKRELSKENKALALMVEQRGGDPTLSGWVRPLDFYDVKTIHRLQQSSGDKEALREASITRSNLLDNI